MTEESAKTPEIQPGPLEQGAAVRPRDVLDHLFGLLGSPAGKPILDKVTEWMGEIKAARVNVHRVEYTHVVFRYLMVAGVLGVAAFLKVKGVLDAEMIGLLSLTLGYLFGRGKAEEKP